jgi:uncharacterized membrane protein YedE/YeeE
MKNLKYLAAGVLFGIVLYKSEVISWFRIQEMFRFQSFHMYGVMIAAVLVGAITSRLLRSGRARALNGEPIAVAQRPFQHGTWIGGTLFGMGWALTGACPGPLYVLVGAGLTVMLAAIASAMLGVWVYAWLDRKLPH